MVTINAHKTIRNFSIYIHVQILIIIGLKAHGPYQLEMAVLISLAIHLTLLILEKQPESYNRRISFSIILPCPEVLFRRGAVRVDDPYICVCFKTYGKINFVLKHKLCLSSGKFDVSQEKKLKSQNPKSK